MNDAASVVSSKYIVTEHTSLLSNNIPTQFPKQWPQHLAALLASTAAMGTGCVAGWSAPAIPYLQGNLGSLPITPITDSEASWVGSIITLGALVGAMPAGKLAGIFGRKWFLLSLTFPMIMGWLIIVYYYENILLIYLGRFIGGMAFGAVTVAVPMYNNEIAEDNVRGVMGVYFDMMWCIGILFAYVMGAYTSFFWLTVSCCLMPIIFFVTFIFMPESPVYLLVKDRKEAAETSLRWLRSGKGKTYNVTIELAKLQQMVDEAEERASAKSGSPMIFGFKTLGVTFKEIFRSTTTKAVIIGFGLMTFQRLSGVSAVVYYTVDIFRGAGTKIKPETAAIIVGVVSVFASCISALFVDRLGRRFLLILSGAAMALSLAVMTVYFIIKDSGVELSSTFTSVPVAVLSCFQGAFRIGYGPVPWLLTAEILSSVKAEIKLWAYSIMVGYAWFLSFIVTKLFPILVESFGHKVIFAFFSGFNFCALWFSWVIVPETKRKSISEIKQEIETRFSGSNGENEENELLMKSHILN